MISLRPSAQRGHADLGWLDSRHSFSFADYHDPQHMGWGNLRVINEDRVAPGRGFGAHAHRDMEIVSYVIDGALSHQDSLGNRSTIVPGDLQRMTAGTGVRHSEYNPSDTQPTHFLQIWLLPDRLGIEPSYQQRHFEPGQLRDGLKLVASRDGRDGSVRLNADAQLRAGRLDGQDRIELALDPQRKGYLHVVRGTLRANGLALQAGDGARLADVERLELDQACDAEVLLFDLQP